MSAGAAHVLGFREMHVGRYCAACCVFILKLLYFFAQTKMQVCSGQLYAASWVSSLLVLAYCKVLR